MLAYIQYNGKSKPYFALTTDLTGYDIRSTRDGGLISSWCSQNIKPSLGTQLNERLRKVWFLNEEFRPVCLNTCKPLSDQEISDLGYEILKQPIMAEEIMNNIEYGG